MKVIRLDGTGWRSPEDFYSALLPALGAPAWHGRNLDALEESLRDDDINAVRLPFSVEVTGVRNATADMREFLAMVATLFRDVRDKDGADVSLELH